MIASINTGINFSYLTAFVPFSLVVVRPGSPSASTSCAITPRSCMLPESVIVPSIPFFQVNVFPLIAFILSIALVIGVIFSLSVISDALNATISFPA